MKSIVVIVRNTISEAFLYRTNFLLWRFRMIVRFLIAYSIWNTVFETQSLVASYSRASMLTYIAVGYVVGSVVLSTRTQELGDEINDGRLSNALLRPQSYFIWILGRDIADKLLNFSLCLLEIGLLWVWLRPPIQVPTDFATWILVGVAIVLGSFLYMLINILLSLSGFWTNEVWAIRFTFFIFLEFLTGWVIPPDLFPPFLSKLVFLTPFPYLYYFPASIWTGRLVPSDPLYLQGFIVIGIWLMVLGVLNWKFWKVGLKRYGAEGR